MAAFSSTRDPRPEGAHHAELDVSTHQFRYRADRLLSASLRFQTTCSFRHRGVEYRDLPIVDLSATGAGIRWMEEAGLRPGDRLRRVLIEHHGESLWSGDAEVSYVHPEPISRAGLRFVGPALHLDELCFRDEFLEHALSRHLSRLEDVEREVPAAWRAAVGMFHQTLVRAREVLDAWQASHDDRSWRRPERSKRLCEAFFRHWNPHVLRLTKELDDMGAAFTPEQREFALSYAQHVIAPEFRHCEFLRRAFEKPRGYAGDYQMMELVQSRELEGSTLYECFLHYYSQNNSLGRTITARCQTARREVEKVLDRNRPARILSLACGPAVELRQMVEEIEGLRHPADLILLDQDEEALRHAYTGISEALGRRDDDLPVRLHCLHFSLKQLLAPKTDAEKALSREVLQGVDLIYSMGLFDYLEQSFARHTVRRIYELLNPGGRLFIGNLVRVPDSTWVMEYGMAWHLTYREPADMIDLVAAIRPAPAEVTVVADRTGHCLFLDAQRAT